MTDSPCDLLPVRMLNEFVYCPRLFHLMRVDGRWADNVYTEDGRFSHRRVDRFDALLPEPGQDDESQNKQAGDDPPCVSRSVTLSSQALGIVAKLDLVSTAGDEAVPVDTKRGRPPDNEHRCWEPERVQLMAQGLLLRANGYRCDHGVIYFAESRTRVDVPFTEELEASTLSYIERARAAECRSTLPDPLDGSPKCHGCSLSGICLPDETLVLRAVPADPVTPVRRLYPARDDAAPLYVQEQGAIVGKTGRLLTVKKRGQELAKVRVRDVGQLVLLGSVSITPAAVHLLCEAGIPIVHSSCGHWFYGITYGFNLKNAFDRAAQFRVADEPEMRTALARSIVTAKGTNQRVMLRRNGRGEVLSQVKEIDRLLKRIIQHHDPDSLRGLEGAIAAQYFSGFAALLRPRDFEAGWNFEKRNRRPPADPVNALLSFAYAVLAKECTVAVAAEGLDPWWGIYHAPRHGRPALALDLMEEFRPLVADSAVVTAVNTGMVTKDSFEQNASACMLKATGRKSLLRAIEARLDSWVTHPIFDYRCSWRQIIRLQARLLARWFRRDVPTYTGMTTR